MRIIFPGQLQGSGYSEQEPEFLSPLENLTVAQGRDIHFTCTVNHLGSYKVRILLLLYLVRVKSNTVDMANNHVPFTHVYEAYSMK